MRMLRIVACAWLLVGAVVDVVARDASALAIEMTTRYAPYADWSALVDVDTLAGRSLSRYWGTPEEIRAARVEGALPLAGLHLALDPGHIGGRWAKDEGRQFRIAAEDYTVREGELVLEVAQRVQAGLRALGCQVTLLRESNRPVNPEGPIDYLPLAAEQVPKPAEHTFEALSAYGRALQARAVRLSIVTGELLERIRLVNESIQPDALLSLHINAAPWPESGDDSESGGNSESGGDSESGGESDGDAEDESDGDAEYGSEGNGEGDFDAAIKCNIEADIITESKGDYLTEIYTDLLDDKENDILADLLTDKCTDFLSDILTDLSADNEADNRFILSDSNHLHALIFGCMSPGELQQEAQREQLAVKLLNGSGAVESVLGDALMRALAEATGLPATQYAGRNAILLDAEQSYLFARNLLMVRMAECPTVLLEPYVANSVAVYPRLQAALANRAEGHSLAKDDILVEYADAVIAGVLACYGDECTE